jgi:Na+-transporting NADH:ubiquinone oxidoreductase subunit A
MSDTIKIKKGLDIQLIGEAKKSLTEITSRTYASKPINFIGVFPKVLVHEGDEVKAGTALFYDKYNDRVKFTSPVSGKVREIRRGPKRVLLEIVVEAGNTIEYQDFGSADPNTLSREQVTEKLLESGIWPVIRQRPYSTIANPDDSPKAIFISAFDTHPLAPDFNFIIEGQEQAFQAGLDALKKLTEGPVHLNVLDKPETSQVFLNAKGVQINRFLGPHPTGNISTQVSRIDPINRGETIWYLRPQEVVIIGRLFLSGKYDASKIYALTGSSVKNPAYFKSLNGVCIDNMVRDNVKEGKQRYISGNALTGAKIEKLGYVDFYDSQITVIPEGDYYEFFGWAMPGFNKFSFYTSFFSWLTPKKKYNLDTNYHGGERAFVMTGKYEQVFPFDIYPMQLIKAIMIEDIDQMENLGIYEIDDEDFALVEFIDTSKTEIQAIVRKGLDLMRKEMT